MMSSLLLEWTEIHSSDVKLLLNLTTLYQLPILESKVTKVCEI